ncbi:MAG: hypothetical protein IPK77_12075 [Cellvibrio sp.]|nr:hypothetical protein [Cellvibrio sp.]
MKKTNLCLSGLIAVCLFLTACSKKSETEQLADMRDSFTYSKYVLLSENGLALGLKAYQQGVKISGSEQMPEITQNEVCIARTLLAYGALVADKNKIALAESDLIDKENCDTFMRGAAGSLRGVIFHREKWPELAAQETKQSQTLLATVSDKETADTQLMALHLALGSNAVMQKDYERAQVHADALALVMEAPWLGKLAQATIHFKEGNVTDGVRDIKRLSEDETVPPQIRSELAKGINEIEAKTGSVDAPAFMGRVLIRGVWDMATEKTSGALSQVSGFVKSQVDDFETEEKK